MATLILNEWIWADLWNENGRTKYEESIQLLTVLADNDDYIVFVIGGRAEEKLWRMCRNDSPEPQRRIGKIFHCNILLNSKKCKFIHVDDLPACPHHLVPEINQDDQYLIQAQLAVPGSIIVTCDTPLIIVLEKEHIPYEYRDRFIELYLK